MTERNNICAVTEKTVIKKVQAYIQKITENPIAGTRTGDVLKDALDSSGKMVRPRLLLLCGSLGPDWYDRLDRLCMMGAMVELTHLSSLIHDDIIDDAPFRRGKPSVQSKYGKDAAVYAGDFIIARIQYWQAKEGLTDAAMRLAQTVEEMCIGEIGQAGCRYREDVTVAAYYQNIKGKTASLFKNACGMGAAEAGCSPEEVDTLERFGEYLGIMFQLRDDLLDFTATVQEVGKQTHKDFRDGIYTLPVLMALETPEGKENLLPIMRENREGTLNGDTIRRMEEIVHGCGGVEATWREIHRYAAEAGRLLDSLGESRSVKTLRKMLEKLDERESH